ncbi:competence/damage-inducible protein A [Urechidicola sp. KH5]
MQAEIITIGDEILIGQITDTNSQYIAKQLNKIGVSVYQITSVQDDRDHILKSLKEAHANADIVILTGGLGPTKDDITKHTLAFYFDSDMTINESIVDHIKSLFKRVNYPFTEVNRMQALVPTKCTPLQNNYGTAPGMWFFENGKVTVSLPGVPYEMRGLIGNSVLPMIQETFQLPHIIHKTVLTYGMGESMVAAKIESWEDELPSYIKLAYLPSYGRVRLRLSAKGTDKNRLLEELKAQLESLKLLIGDIIVGMEEEETIEVAVAKQLSDKKYTIATAESCTGGTIAKLLTSVPGASNYFKGSLVAYTKEIKEQELNVDSALIQKYSVVSTQVAEAMALGAQSKFQTDFAIATSGNAGPTTDDTDKTVGVVIIAIATPTGVISEEFNFGQPREKVINRSANKAFELIRQHLK